MAERPVLRTALCDHLGIEYPVLAAPMGGVGGPRLVAAASKAGGLGVLAAAFMGADDLRAAIAQIRKLTRQPFGVNLLYCTDLRPPPPPEAVPVAASDAVHAVLNPMRSRLGLPAGAGRPDPPPDAIPANLEVILEERVPLFSVGLGDPGPDLVKECHRRGMQVMAMVTTPGDAVAVERSGVDIVVAQGYEAGGHRSHFTKPARPERGGMGGLALVPAVVDAVRIPVVAAGGIADGRGLAAALALGAAGVMMGTRFIASRESDAPEMYRQAVMERGADDTTLTDGFSGRWARAFRNAFTERWEDSRTPVLPFFWQLGAGGDIYRAAGAAGDPEHFPMWAGHSAELVHDLPSAGDIVRRTVRQANAVLKSLPR